MKSTHLLLCRVGFLLSRSAPGAWWGGKGSSREGPCVWRADGTGVLTAPVLRFGLWRGICYTDRSDRGLGPSLPSSPLCRGSCLGLSHIVEFLGMWLKGPGSVSRADRSQHCGQVSVSTGRGRVPRGQGESPQAAHSPRESSQWSSVQTSPWVLRKAGWKP